MIKPRKEPTMQTITKNNGRVHTVNSKILESCAFLSITLRAWGNRRKAVLCRRIYHYPYAIVAAQVSLGALFNQDDYPTADEVISRFAIEHAWLTFDVARNIPLEVQQHEIVKFQEKLKEAETEILFALREAFASMVEHFVRRLNAIREGGKPPIIKDSLLDNFNEFFNTFSARNIMEDAELSRLVERSKEILRNIHPETLRKSESIRQRTLHAFNDVKKAIDELIKERPVRRFALNEEEEG
jgi:hypothetical protein